MTEAAGVQYDGDAIQRMSTIGGGVYARQRPANSRPPSLPSGSIKSKGPDDDVGKDGDVDDRDLKQKQVCRAFHLKFVLTNAPQVFKGWYLLW
jgi:hypothetical protein